MRMRSGWGWGALSGDAMRRHDIAWLRPFVAAAPWLTLLALVLMLHLLGGAMTMREGVLFDLPDTSIADGERTPLVALLLPMTRETLVFFDDARFVLGDGQSMETFREQLAERAAKLKINSLLVLADRRVTAGELMNFATVAKGAGVSRILFAKRHAEDEL